MIVLDTSIVSELTRARPTPEVLAWLDRQDAGRLFVAAVTEAEVRTGIALLLGGWRRDGLAAAADQLFGEVFGGRVLAFDAAAAQAYAEIAANRRTARRPISQVDCQVAAIAKSRGMAVATGDVEGFVGCGVEVIDPWAGETAVCNSQTSGAEATPARPRRRSDTVELNPGLTCA